MPKDQNVPKRSVREAGAHCRRMACRTGIIRAGIAKVSHPRAPASRSARVRRRAPFLGGRLACRAVAPYHVVKMRDARSLRVFNENYPLSRSFSLRVVGVTPPHPLARVLYPRAPMLFVCSLYKHSCCQGTAPENFAGGGIIPPHPHTIALSLFHTSDLSRNSVEKFRGRGYYTPTPPSCCEML